VKSTTNGLPIKRLTPATVRLLADKFPRFGDQFPIFAEFRGLKQRFNHQIRESSSSPGRKSAPVLRANAIGIFQANIGLWQILRGRDRLPMKT